MILEAGPYKVLINENETLDLYKKLKVNEEITNVLVFDSIKDYLMDLNIDYAKPSTFFKYKEEGILDFYRGTYLVDGNVLSGPKAYRLVNQGSDIEEYEFTGSIHKAHDHFQYYIDEDYENGLVMLEFNLIVQNIR